jgi:hypothetical protein
VDVDFNKRGNTMLIIDAPFHATAPMDQVLDSI